MAALYHVAIRGSTKYRLGDEGFAGRTVLRAVASYRPAVTTIVRSHRTGSRICSDLLNSTGFAADDD